MLIDFTRPRLKIIGYALTALLVIAGVIYWHNRQEDRFQQAIVVQQETLKSLNAIQNRLHMNEQNALAFQEKLKQVENGRIQPVTNYYVAAPTVQAAADKVQEQIKNKDPALPPAALANTDRTAVVPNLEKQKVDVYKWNLYRNWEWSSGVGWNNGNMYVPIGLQRNFSKDKAFEAEIHQDANDFKRTIGGEVKAVWKTDKLFFMF